MGLSAFAKSRNSHMRIESLSPKTNLSWIVAVLEVGKGVVGGNVVTAVGEGVVAGSGAIVVAELDDATVGAMVGTGSTVWGLGRGASVVGAVVGEQWSACTELMRQISLWIHE